ncbi:MAG: MarR family winged helix-turn-helix transcriptional regulator [Bacteroidia bacterium]
MKTTTVNAVATESSFMLLSQITNLWQADISAELKEHHLTLTEFTILSSVYWLAQQKSEVTQVNVCTHSNTKAMNASIILRKLQALGFLKRKEHSIDTRAKTISLTPKGADIIKNILIEVNLINNRFFSISKNKEESFIKKLEDIRNINMD